MGHCSFCLWFIQVYCLFRVFGSFRFMVHSGLRFILIFGSLWSTVYLGFCSFEFWLIQLYMFIRIILVYVNSGLLWIGFWVHSGLWIILVYSPFGSMVQSLKLSCLFCNTIANYNFIRFISTLIFNAMVQ